jgi:acyl-CoA synthetase (NDP forming)
VVLGSSALREPETICVPLRECLARSDKPIVSYASPEAPHLVRQLNMAGLPTFAAPESCVAALAAMRKIAETTPAEIDAAVASAPVDEDVRSMLRRGSFNETESKALFARFGIRATQEIAVATPGEAVAAAYQLKGRLVVKILSREVSHKSEVGGVTLDVSPDEVEQTCRHQAETFTRITQRKPEGFLIQEMVTGGVELVLGMKQDPQMGPVILLGMGGVAAEVVRDTALRLAPVSRRDAQEMIDELRMSPILKGFRGGSVADVAALIDAIVAISTMAMAIGDELSEAEINPLFVLRAGCGVVAADGVVIPRLRP